MIELFNWLMIIIGYFSSVICSMLLFTAKDQIPEQTVNIIFWTGLFIGTIGLIIQARKDLYHVCMFTTISGFLATIIFASITHYGTVPHPVSSNLAVIGALLTITSVAYLIWCQYAVDKTPNILRQYFHPKNIQEIEGLQFVITHNGEMVPAGESFNITLFLQNSWSDEISASFVIKNKTLINLSYSEESIFVIPPGAVLKISIPVTTTLNELGKFELLCDLKLKNRGKSKLRRWHANAYTPPVSAVMTGLALLVGHIHCGGGIKIKGQVTPQIYNTNIDKKALRIETEILWTFSGNISKEKTSYKRGYKGYWARVLPRNRR